MSIDPRSRIPYPGLRAYAQSETDLFFGREGCINDMVDRIAKSRFLAVLGASGSGKSSLVRTGLLDALELGLHVSAGPAWVIVDLHPDGSAIRNLAQALMQATKPGAGSFEIDNLDTFLRRGPRSIVEWVDEGNLRPEQNLLLLVDQFEELFRYGDYAGREEAEAFTGLLLESVRAHPRINVIITMRSEYLGACALIPGLAEIINSSLYLTRRMTRGECWAAIVGPAGVVGFDIESALVTKLLNDLSAIAPWETDRESSQQQRLSRQADQLPLMQHALSRLWQLAKRRSNEARTTLSLQDYLDIGQLRGALGQHGEEVIARLSDAAKTGVEPVFRSLISGTTLADAVRRPMRFADLCRIAGLDEPVVREVVDAFRADDCNFLRPSEEQALSAETIVDVSHESLIRQWDRLSSWLASEAMAQSLWGRLVYGAERHNAGQGELLTGLDLANALAWWDEKRPTREWSTLYGGKFDEVDAFLRRSREREEQRTLDEKSRGEKERLGLRKRAATYLVLAVIGAAVCTFSLYDNYNLTQARNDLKASTDTANRAKNSAERSLLESEAADDKLMSGADLFVIGLAKRLEVLPGIPSEQVQKLLKDGKDYLDGLAEGTPKHADRVARMRARFDAAAARSLIDLGQYQKGRDMALEGESLIKANARSGALSGEDVLAVLDVGGIIADSLNRANLDNMPEAQAKAREMLKMAEALPEDAGGVSLFERATAHYHLAYALSDKDTYNQAAAESNQCIGMLERIGGSRTPEENVLLGRCHVLRGFVLARLAKRGSPEARRENELALQLFKDVPADNRTIPMLAAYSLAVSNHAWDFLEKKNYPEARRLYMQSADLIKLTDVDVKEKPVVRSELVDRYTSVGNTFKEESDYIHAIEWYEKATATGLMDDEWRSSVDLADKVDTALDALAVALIALPYDAENLAKIETAERQRLMVVHYLIENGHASWCVSCELTYQQRQFAALVNFDRIRGEDRYKEASALEENIARQAKAILANRTSGSAATIARRAWFWSVFALPVEAPEMPSVRGEKGLLLRRLDISRDKLLDFLAAFPKSWFAEVRLGEVEYSRAIVLEELGRYPEALSAAESGKQHFDINSTRLLERWYEKGSGPVARDTSKAEVLTKELTSRNWSVRHFSVPGRWIGSAAMDRFPVTVYVEDPRTAGDDVVARLKYQLETIEGIELPTDFKEALTKYQKLAAQENLSFADLAASEEVKYADASDRLAAIIKISALKKTPLDGAADEMIKVRVSTGIAAVGAGLQVLLGDESASTNYSTTLMDLAKLTDKRREPGVSEAILDALLSKQYDPDTAQLALLLEWRGDVRESLGNPDGAVSDYAAAVSLQPDNATYLNSEAYLWVRHERHERLSAAVDLLQRAVMLAPNSAEIRDSLGWAEVVNGQLEVGLQKLESAAADKPREPEILMHLADTYRRLGRESEARAMFSRARALPTRDADVKEFIQRQQSLLGPVAAIDR